MAGKRLAGSVIDVGLLNDKVFIHRNSERVSEVYVDFILFPDDVKKIILCNYIADIARISGDEIPLQRLVVYNKKTNVLIEGKARGWSRAWYLLLVRKEADLFEVTEAEKVEPADVIVDYFSWSEGVDYCLGADGCVACPPSLLPAFYGLGDMFIDTIRREGVVVVKRGVLLYTERTSCRSTERRLVVYDAEKGLRHSEEFYVSEEVVNSEEDLRTLLESIYKRFFPS